MSSESQKTTERDVFSLRAKDKIADELQEVIIGEIQDNDTSDRLKEILRDGFEGTRNMKDQNLFALAQQIGYFDEDAEDFR